MDFAAGDLRVNLPHLFLFAVQFDRSGRDVDLLRIRQVRNEVFICGKGQSHRSLIDLFVIQLEEEIVVWLMYIHDERSLDALDLYDDQRRGDGHGDRQREVA